MALKNLNQFAPFQAEKFLEGKLLMVTNCMDATDYETKAIVGSKIEVAIVKDNTVYEKTKDGLVVNNNLLEKLSVKLPRTGIKIPQNTYISLVNPSGTIYGQFRNQLSLKADDYKIINSNNTEG